MNLSLEKSINTLERMNSVMAGNGPFQKAMLNEVIYLLLKAA